MTRESRFQLFTEELLHGSKGFESEAVFAWRTMNDQRIGRLALFVRRPGSPEKLLHALLGHTDVLRRRPKHERPRRHGCCKIALVAHGQHVWHPPIEAVVAPAAHLQKHVHRTNSAADWHSRGDTIVDQPGVEGRDAAKRSEEH